jgi:methyl-accepting chemotaxis protein
MSGFTIRLTHKIMAIGAVGLIGILSVGAIYQLGSWSEESSRAIAQTARANSNLNNKIATNMLQARRAEKDFQLRRDQAYAKRHAELSTNVLRELDALKRQLRTDALTAEGVDAVRSGYENYAREFSALEQAEVKLGLNETLGLSGSLRAAVHDIEAKLKESDEPRLTSAMLMLRRHEKDFMLRRDQKYVGELKKAVVEFTRQLELSSLEPVAKSDISRKLQKYQSDFLAWTDGMQQVVSHSAAMSKEFHRIEPVIVEIGQRIEERYKQGEAAEASTRTSIQSWVLIAFTLAVVVVSVTSLLIGKSISNALLSMVRAMTRLAKGDATVDVPGLGRGDEIGEMAGTVEVFKRNMIETERLRAEQREIERVQAERRKAEMAKLADSFEAAVGEIVETVSSASTELEASATTLTSTAARSQELATSVASASEEATTNVQSVASATEELTSSVTEISRQVQESASMANEAVNQARITNERVRELSSAAARIGDVVELINTIAGQTNLLALNATIEAARAGEAGRGFAVVASEVKALAEQTAKATGEISQQISGIQGATEESASAIREISSTIEKLSEIASTIASAVEEQGAATQEISRNIQHAAQGTHQVSSSISDVQHGATATGTASAQVLSAAQMLSGDSNRLKVEVSRFLDVVRAA